MVEEKLKVKVESLEPWGENKLIVGAADGSILVFDVEPSSSLEDPFVVNLVGNKKFAKKNVYQVSVMEDERVIVALADSYVHVLDSNLSGSPIRLDATKGANIYALDMSGPVVRLAVGVGKKKLVLFRWSGPMAAFEFWKEMSSPDTIRAMVWAGDSLCVGFRRKVYTLIHVNTGASIELFPTGGDPSCLLLPDSEILLGKEHLSAFVGFDGKPSAHNQAITWSELPLAVQYSFPYVLGLLSRSVEVRSLHTMNQVQTIPIAKPRRLAAKGSVVYVASSMAIYRLQPIPLLIQINELVEERLYEEAICLTQVAPELETINRQERLLFIKMLYAYSLFSKGSYDDAMHLFFQLKVNPAQVISMFPDLLPMSHRRNYKYPFNIRNLTGGELKAALEALVKYLPQVRTALIRQSQSRTARAVLIKVAREADDQDALEELLADSGGADNDESGAGGKSSKEETGSVLDGGAGPSSSSSFGGGSYGGSYGGAAASSSSSSSSSAAAAASSSVGVSEDDIRLLGSVGRNTILFVDPEDPTTVLTIFQDSSSLRQIVDTSLLKAYLKVKPTLAASLLRIENSCHVGACEEVLLEAQKYQELILLYKSKGLHAKALKRLKTLAKESGSPMAGPHPTVEYLRGLGVNSFDLILEYSVWVLGAHPQIGLEIFTYDNAATRTLPAERVVVHIEEHAPTMVQAYLEHVVFERNTASPSLHNKLAYMYLKNVSQALKASPRPAGSGPVRVAQDRGGVGEARRKLLNFVQTSTHCEGSKILSRLAPLELDGTELYEERAILLAGIGSHKEALIIYVYGLNDMDMAVAHCNTYYRPGVEGAQDVYLTLLTVCMSPPDGIDANPDAAMEVLNTYSGRIDIPSALELLPVTTSLADLLPFFESVLKENSQKYRSSLILRNVLKSEHLAVRERLIHERSRHVLLEDKQTCPVCHKRILASHSTATYPNNIVVHYRCASKEKDVCPVTGVRFLPKK